MNHLLQTLVYKYEFPELECFKLVYMGRDKARRIAYEVKLVQDEVDNKIIHRPEVEGTALLDFTMEDVLQRYVELDAAIKAKTPPPKDFELKYSDQKIEKLHQDKKLSTLKYNKWKKCKSSTHRDWPGDWQCSYCPFNALCWSPGGKENDLSDLILE